LAFSIGDYSKMTGPLPAGRSWTRAEVTRLHELIAAGVKVGLIARKLNRSPGAIYARITSSKKTPRDLTFDAKRLSLPSERLAFIHENSQNSCLVERGLKTKPKL
jgi:hypothetical protein